MRQNAPSCSAWRLYVILDSAAANDRSLWEIAEGAIRGGADVLQLRHKMGTARELIEEARRLLPLTRSHGVPLIINDMADVAQWVDADGVHLGQDDLPVAAARRLLGPGKLIGKSTHTLEQALAADTEEIDYLGLGPIFATPTKPDYGSVGLALIPRVQSRLQHPCVCIGGIDQQSLDQVLEAGAERVAVVRAVCAADHPESATRALKQQLVQFSRTHLRS